MPLSKSERDRIKAYFQNCPLCYSVDSASVDSPPFRTSNVLCKKCSAKWELHYKLGKLVGIKLIQVDLDGKGKEFLEVEARPEFWQKMGLKGVKKS